MRSIHIESEDHARLLVFDAHNLDGLVEPRVHLTLSPIFALQLARVLQDIVEPYTREPYTRAPEAFEVAEPKMATER